MKKDITKINKLSASANLKKMKSKLVEMEQTISSIQSGKVDALIIHNDDKRSAIYTLEGADEPYRILIENLSEGALTVTEQGKIIHCNNHFCDLIKVSDSNLANTALSDYLPLEQRQVFTDLLNQKKETSKKSEFTLIASDNTIKTVLLSCQSLKFGKVNSICIIVTDISEIKAVQLETFKAKERYRTLMDNASCGVLVHDMTGNIIEVNKETEHIFGQPRSEIINNNIISYIDEQQSIIEMQFNKLIVEKKIGPLVMKIKTVKADTKMIELSAVSVGTGISNENLLLSVINDITERRKLEEQSLLKDKLSTIGTLSAGIVHEINNPLTWIMSNLKYLKKKIVNYDNQDIKSVQSFNDIIDETIKGTKQIHDIVINLKGFARKDEDKPPTPVDINEILNSAIHMASHQINDVAELKTNFAGNLPKLLLSGGRLHQVFLNLIVNAIQAFSGKDSRNIISINTCIEENNIRIDIADTGCGISPDQLPNIFNLFYTTKPTGVGTGLGLSICHDIVSREGGKITVVSSPEQGTIFSVYFPIQKSNRTLPAALT
jgi:PAS domain S-box-containing protein